MSNDDEDKKTPENADAPGKDESTEDETPEFDVEEIENDPAYSPEDEGFKGIKGG